MTPCTSGCTRRPGRFFLRARCRGAVTLRRESYVWATLLLLCGPSAARAGAQAGVTSLARTVALNATKSSALSVSIISGAAASLPNLTDNAVNIFPTPVRVTAAWTVSRAATNEVRLLAYFTSPAQALSNGPNFIAASLVRGRVLTTPVTTWQPTSWTAFTQNSSRGVGVNAATLRIFRIPISATNANGSRTFDLELQIDLTGQPAVTTGTYTGSITIRAFTT